MGTFNMELQTIPQRSNTSPSKHSSAIVFSAKGTSPIDQSIKANSLLSDYTPIATLRQTLQGSVEKMRHKETGQVVAVKVSLKSLVEIGRSASGVRIAEDVIAEQRILKILSKKPCANLTQLLDYRQDDSRHCLILEFASGGELFDLVQRSGGLSERRSLRLFKDMLRGLQFMHEAQICHLDMSLENILISDKGVAKICDLGLARHFQRGIRFRGRKNERPGKLSYMSPEIYSGADFDGPSSDIWSLGIILFVMLFGFPPFEVAAIADQRYVFLQKRGLSALLSEWNLSDSVHPDAIDLLSSMLAPEAHRISLRAIACHPWLSIP